MEKVAGLFFLLSRLLFSVFVLTNPKAKSPCWNKRLEMEIFFERPGSVAVYNPFFLKKN